MGGSNRSISIIRVNRLKNVLKKLPDIIILAILFIFSYIYAKIVLNTLYSHNSFDLYVYLQKLWNTLHGKFWCSSELAPACNIFHHTDFTVLLLLPIMSISFSPLTLKLIQSFLLVYTAFIIYILFRDKNRIIGILIAMLYLMLPPILWSNIINFHTRIMFPLFFFLTIYFAEKDRRSLSCLSAILASFSDEIGALFLILWFLSKYIRDRENILNRNLFYIALLSFIIQFIIIFFASGYFIWNSNGSRWSFNGILLDTYAKIKYLREFLIYNLYLILSLIESPVESIILALSVLLLLFVKSEYSIMYLFEASYSIIPITIGLATLYTTIKNNSRNKKLVYAIVITLFISIGYSIKENLAQVQDFLKGLNYDPNCEKLAGYIENYPFPEKSFILADRFLLPFLYKWLYVGYSDSTPHQEIITYLTTGYPIYIVTALSPHQYVKMKNISQEEITIQIIYNNSCGVIYKIYKTDI